MLRVLCVVQHEQHAAAGQQAAVQTILPVRIGGDALGRNTERDQEPMHGLDGRDGRTGRGRPEPAQVNEQLPVRNR